jgi:hypothetical protein
VTGANVVLHWQNRAPGPASKIADEQF